MYMPSRCDFNWSEINESPSYKFQVLLIFN
jgi:hypothetical protein